MTLELLDSVVRITANSLVQDIKLDTPQILKVKKDINKLVVSLQEKNFDWKTNDNELIFELVKSTMDVLKLIKKYKALPVSEKKNICFNLIERLIELEIQNLEIEEEMKKLATVGIDTIIEPIIEIMILTILQKQGILSKICSCVKKN